MSNNTLSWHILCQGMECILNESFPLLIASQDESFVLAANATHHKYYFEGEVK